MWKFYEVELSFTGRLCGSVPLSSELVPTWLKSRMPKNKPENGKSVEEIQKEVEDSIEEAIERTTVGFQSHDGALAVRAGTIKAHLKDCANQIKEAITPQIKLFRSKVANKCYIEPYWVPILDQAGNPVTESDGTYEQPVHVMTPKGPRNALKIIHYLNQPILRFTLRLLKDKEVKINHVKEVFKYGTIHGYGGERGMGEGQYEFKIKEKKD